MADAPTKKKSALALELEARAANRKYHRFPASDFCSPGSQWKSRIAIQVAFKGEEMGAIVDAAAYAKKLARGEEVNDHDLNTDNRTLHIIWTTVRDGESREGMKDDEVARVFPAFDSVQWMASHLTADEIAVLLNLVNLCIAKESPIEQRLDPETVGAVFDAIAGAGDIHEVRHILSRVDRPWLEVAFQIACDRLKDAEMRAGVAAETDRRAETLAAAGLRFVPDSKVDDG